MRVRQATFTDLSAIADLVPLAGVRLEDALAEAVRDGFSGAALPAGIRAGQPGFQHHMATQFLGHRDLVRAYLHASLRASRPPRKGHWIEALMLPIAACRSSTPAWSTARREGGACRPWSAWDGVRVRQLVDAGCGHR